MSQRKPHLRNKQFGQAMLEFALIFPLLIFLIYGLMEFGRMLFIYVSVVNASREAARFGASVGNTGAYRFSDCAGILNAAQRNAILNSILSTDMTISYDRGPGTTPYATVCSTAINNIVALGDRINVTVRITYSPLMPIDFATFPITATSSRTIIRGVEIVGSNVALPGQPTVTFSSSGPASAVDEGAGSVSFQVLLDPATSETVVVPLYVSGDATSGTDFSVSTTTVTFVPGDTSEPVTITIQDDALDEYDETVVITMGNPINADKGSPSTYTLVIADNDDPPDLFFALASSSGNEGTVRSIAVSLSEVSGKDVTFEYDFIEPPLGALDRAREIADFTMGPVSPITIPAGSTGATLQAVLKVDFLYELDELAIFQLLSVVTDPIDPGTPTAVITAPSQHNLTIINIDPKPRISFEIATSTTGENIETLTLRIRIDRPSALPSIANIAVGGTSTATAVSDYILPASATLTIPAGQLFVDYTIRIVNDLEPPDEKPETLVLNLAPGDANVVLGDFPIHTVTILETTTAPNVYFSPASRQAREDDGQVAVFLALSNAWNAPVVVNLSVAGTLTNGVDYTLLSSTTITIPAGYVTGSLLVSVIDDILDEDNETLILTISGASGATPVDPKQYVLTIIDNDDPPTVSFAQAASSYEEGYGAVSLAVNLSTASARQIQVSFAVTGGTAVSGTDYTLITASPLTFAPGVVSQVIDLDIPDNTIYSGSRIVTLTLSGPVNATLVAPETHTLTIIEDEVCPSITNLTFNDDQISTIVAMPTGASTTTLESMRVVFDTLSGQHFNAAFLGTGGTSLIYSGDIATSPVTVSESGSPTWTGGDRTLDGGEGKVLLLVFQNGISSANRNRYAIQLTWSNGCTASKP